MPGVGVGGLFANLFNPGLDDRLAQHVTPNPNPLAQQGGPPNPKAVDSLGNPVPSGPPPGSNLAPPAVTQPDPVNSAYAADLLKAHRMDALSADLNRNLEGMAAGFGTAAQQASKQNALARGGGVGVGDSLGALSQIQAMQDQTIQDNEHARFMGNAAVFAQTLSQSLGRPVSIQEATEIMNNKGLLEQFGGAAAGNAAITSTQKDAEAATRAYAIAHPEASAKDIADYKANLIAGGMGGSDLEQRQYLQEKAAGLTTDDYATWKSKKAAQGGALATQAKDIQDFKDTATTDYTAAHSKLTDMQRYIDTLTKDPDAARAALQYPAFLTTGSLGSLPNGIPQNVKDAAIALNKVRSSLTGESLQNVKNVRNVREFNTLGQAATAGLDPAASDADFKAALNTLKNRYLDTQATTELAVGHKLTGDLVGHGNRDLLDPKSPWYNGGSEEKAASDFSGMSVADADKAYEALPSGAEFTDTDGKRKKKP